MNFEVFRKRGTGWQLLGVYRSQDSLLAAWHAQRVHGGRTFGVRPEGTAINLYTYHLSNYNGGK